MMKGERCLGPKCASTRRGTKPGMHGKRRSRKESEFAQELQEKQKVRYAYGLTDTALRKVFAEASRKPGKTSSALVQMLERRLDNAVYRAGFAISRSIARHAVSHGHFLVNGRRVNIPSYRVKKGDVIGLRPSSKGKGHFTDVSNRFKKYEPPQWIAIDRAKEEATIQELPREELVPTGKNLRLVVEYYSK